MFYQFTRCRKNKKSYYVYKLFQVYSILISAFYQRFYLRLLSSPFIYVCYPHLLSTPFIFDFYRLGKGFIPHQFRFDFVRSGPDTLDFSGTFAVGKDILRSFGSAVRSQGNGRKSDSFAGFGILETD